MKVIRNDRLQSIIIYLSSEKGTKEVWLQPKNAIQVPDSYLTDQVRTLQARRILNIANA